MKVYHTSHLSLLSLIHKAKEKDMQTIIAFTNIQSMFHFLCVAPLLQMSHTHYYDVDSSKLSVSDQVMKIKSPRSGLHDYYPHHIFTTQLQYVYTIPIQP